MSFKAINAVHERGVSRFVASSGGNAGLAVAYAASQLSIPCRVFVPSTTPASARSLIESYGAECVVEGDVYSEADALARREGEEDGVEYFSAYDDPELWEGHASIISEIKEQLPSGSPKPRAIILSVGGGGLLCGVVEGLHKVGWEDVPVVAMETELANCFARAQEAGKIVEMRPGGIAKSLGASRAAEQTMVWNEKHDIRSVVISDQSAVMGCDEFQKKHRMLVEPACGASVATMFDSSLLERSGISMDEEGGGGPVVVVVCGGAMIDCDVLKNYKKEVGL